MITLAEALQRAKPPDGFADYARRFSAFEDIWKNCQRADWMLWMLQFGPARTRRGLRLFICRGARQWWHFIFDPRSQRAVLAAERLTDNNVSTDTIRQLRSEAKEAVIEAAGCSRPVLTRAALLGLLALEDDCLTAAQEALRAIAFAEHAVNNTRSDEHEMVVMAEQAAILHELLGNPFSRPDSQCAA